MIEGMEGHAFWVGLFRCIVGLLGICVFQGVRGLTLQFICRYLVLSALLLVGGVSFGVSSF